MEYLMDTDKCRIVFRSPGHVGASNGFSTEYFCYELEASTPILHAYPISEAEAKEICGDYSIVFTDYLRWLVP
jgi:hypothetical protein